MTMTSEVYHTEVDEEGGPRIVRQGNIISFIGEPGFPTFEADRNIVALRTATDSDDHTEVDLGEPEMLTIRQIAEDGTAHTICLSPKMTAELARLLDTALRLGKL